MALSITRYIALSLLCIGVSAAQAAEPKSPQATAQAQNAELQSAHDFVQGFYDWYVQQAEQEKDGWPSMTAALKNERWPFSDEIKKALQADTEAQAKVEGYIVGIDFDPFLNAQDTCFPYKAGKAIHAGNRYQVEVFSNCAGSHPERATVIPVVDKRNGTWLFVNFIYPDDTTTDLLSTLQALKKDREEHPKPPSEDQGGLDGPRHS
ncbi:MAG TPA: hypothetical protein VF651_08365 [Gammaproteobacteria bacterium]